jgi:glycosyltransferase involved in cell wall biosynthesis
MENILDLSIILPIKTNLVKDFTELFSKSIESIQLQSDKPKELIIVHSSEENLIDFLESYDFGDLNVRKIKFDEEPNFSSQVNLGIEKSNTKWVSILEFDDEYAKIWFKNVKSYIEVYPDVDAFLPIVVDVDSKMVFAGFTNEATFAANFSQEMGYLTNETLLNYQNFQTSGMVFKKLIVEDFGGFKPSFKLTFPYEFLLRMTYNSAKIMTIPKIGYKHMNLREGSLFWEYKNGENKVGESEVQFWVSSAKKEYFFSTDRDIKYSQENA